MCQRAIMGRKIFKLLNLNNKMQPWLFACKDPASRIAPNKRVLHQNKTLIAPKCSAKGLKLKILLFTVTVILQTC